ncbi:MAG TPA: elongation factor 1-beta [Candidatus Nanoarchaeia archaeon]|nr:elongation factor 1-beta [Candidatus Nanoarchaeia archaeon]
MATVVITFKIMPESPEIDLSAVEKQAKDKILAHAGPGDTKTEIEPIAFGLKALKITFLMDEQKGGTEPLEEQVNTIEGVQSCEVIDVRRAVG